MAMLAWPGVASAQSTNVFSTDFESGLPAQFTAPGSVIEGVQGYAGLGPSARQFAGSFLRYTSVPLFDTHLTLTGLPAHDHLKLSFLLAVIDSWDGTELLQVLVDGNLLFSHTFQLATGDASSYSPPPGGLLSSGTDLGFSGGTYYQHDRAYDLSFDPAFNSIPHTASSVDIVWRISAVSGPAADQWQGGSDESWAIDRVAVRVTNGVVGVGNDPSLAFGLDPIHPNPLKGDDLMVQFALAGSEQARLELVDVTGRRVAQREVTGAGRHVIDLGREHALPPGIYMVRLSQGANVRVRRAVVLD
jgi:hypothetical protein